MNNWYPQLPAWIRQQRAPRMPFQNVASGQQRGTFNPGNAFGPGSANEIPSMQRWGRLAPTERQGMASWWEDEMGVSGDDVMWTMEKLRPKGSFSSAPRWSY